jgi:hypothetical protein
MSEDIQAQVREFAARQTLRTRLEYYRRAGSAPTWWSDMEALQHLLEAAIAWRDALQAHDALVTAAMREEQADYEGYYQRWQAAEDDLQAAIEHCESLAGPRVPL